MGPTIIWVCPVYDSGGNRPGHFRVVIPMAPPGLCIGQRPNHSVCALLGAEAGARGGTPFSWPDPSFADTRRRYPRVGCRHDRIERTVLGRVLTNAQIAVPLWGHVPR